MTRPICYPVLLLAACTAVAAPAPMPFKTGWDKPVDPNRDCKFVIKGTKLTIEVPGTDHDFAPKRERFNAPRLLRDIEGDFVMQVKVCGSFRPSAKSTVDGEKPKVAAGLLLIPVDKNCIRLEYEACRRNGELDSYPEFRMQGEQIYNMHMGWEAPWKKDSPPPKEEHIYLRIERREQFIYEALSPDGEKWTSQFNIGVRNLPAKLKVGLAAYSNSTEPFKPTFDEFKLIRIPKKKK